MDGSPLVGPTLKGLSGSSVQAITAGKRRTIVADDACLRKSITVPRAVVVVGYKDMMPSSEGTLTDRQVTEIGGYIKELEQGVAPNTNRAGFEARPATEARPYD